eukprot:471992-Pyramimonas_sp.AAC.2
MGNAHARACDSTTTEREVGGTRSRQEQRSGGSARGGNHANIPTIASAHAFGPSGRPTNPRVRPGGAGKCLLCFVA